VRSGFQTSAGQVGCHPGIASEGMRGPGTSWSFRQVQAVVADQVEKWTVHWRGQPMPEAIVEGGRAGACHPVGIELVCKKP